VTTSWCKLMNQHILQVLIATGMRNLMKKYATNCDTNLDLANLLRGIFLLLPLLFFHLRQQLKFSLLFFLFFLCYPLVSATFTCISLPLTFSAVYQPRISSYRCTLTSDVTQKLLSWSLIHRRSCTDDLATLLILLKTIGSL